MLLISPRQAKDSLLKPARYSMRLCNRDYGLPESHPTLVRMHHQLGLLKRKAGDVDGAEFAEKESIRWAIEPLSLDESIGSIGIFDIDPNHGHGEMGTVIHRDYWSQGFDTEAGRLVLDYAFSKLGLSQVKADCLSENFASRRVLEKLGFTEHAVIPDYRTSGGKNIEGLLYVIEHSEKKAQ